MFFIRSLTRNLLRRWADRRGLYIYHDGRRTRRADWLRLWRRFCAVEMFADEEVMAAVDQQRDPQCEAYLQEVARLFCVDRYDERTGRGMTDQQLLALVEDFAAFILQKKSEGEAWRTSSAPADPASSRDGPDCAATTSTV